MAAVFGAIGELRGGGWQAARREALGALFARATAREAEWLRRLLLGDVRQGALAGVMADAIAAAADVPKRDLRRGLMLRGDLPAIAEIALTEGEAGLAAVRLEGGRPLQ